MERLLIELFDLEREKNEDNLSAQLSSIDFSLHLVETDQWNKIEIENGGKTIEENDFQGNIVYEGSVLKMLNNIPVSGKIRKKCKKKN